MSEGLCCPIIWGFVMEIEVCYTFKAFIEYVISFVWQLRGGWGVSLVGFPAL